MDSALAVPLNGLNYLSRVSYHLPGTILRIYLEPTLWFL